jgi:hypothetical protein
MKMLNKTLLAAVISAATLPPISAMAQTSTPLTCSGAPPIVAALEATVRREEAVRKGTEVINKVIHGLNVQILTPIDSPEFTRLMNFVLDLQLDPDKPEFYIEGFNQDGTPRLVGDRAAFRNVGVNNVTNFKYRNRDITNWIVDEYQDVNCRRTITLNGLGHTYGVLKNPPVDQPAPALPNRRSSRTFVDLDRIKVIIVEKEPGVFKSKAVYQFTEASFPFVFDEVRSGLNDPRTSPLKTDGPAYLPLKLESQ